MQIPDPPGLVVRRALASDREGVWALVRNFAQGFRPEEDSFQESFDALLRSDDSLVVVAETKENEIVGYLMANSHTTFLETRPIVWVEEVMVDERNRRSGIGTALMTATEEWGSDCGAAYVALASRSASAFYLALGYDDAAVFYKKSLS